MSVADLLEVIEGVFGCHTPERSMLSPLNVGGEGLLVDSDCSVSGLVTHSILFGWLFTIKDRRKQVRFQQTRFAKVLDSILGLLA